MEFLSGIVDILSTNGLGVITGLIGGWLAKREERKLFLLKAGHEVSMANIDLENSKLENAQMLAMADKSMEQAEIEGEIAMDIADSNLVVATVNAQAKHSGNAIIDGILRFVRPVIAIYLLVVTTMLANSLSKIIGNMNLLNPSIITDLYVHIIESTVLLTFIAVGWWFGARGGNLLKSQK